MQLIEIPSSFKPVFLSIAQSSDGLILLYKTNEELDMLKNMLLGFRIRRPFIEVERNENLESIKRRAWEMLGLIRVYCKEPGKKPETRAMVMSHGSDVEDAASRIHKDFIKYFRFARVWGSSKFPGEKVGAEYVLKDRDVLEIHMG